MYRIQAFNQSTGFWIVHNVREMLDKNRIVSEMKDSGHYLSISVEWLRRYS